MRAARWLADRGFGKAPITIEMKDGEALQVDLSALSYDEAKQFLALIEKIPAAGAKPVSDGAEGSPAS